MKTSRLPQACCVVTGLALSALACGSRSNLEPLDEFEVGGRTGHNTLTAQGGFGTGGYTFGTGGKTYASSWPVGGQTWGTGGKSVTGGTKGYTGGTRSSGGTTYFYTNGGTTRISSSFGGTTYRTSTYGGSSYGGTTYRTSTYGGSSYGGTTHYGGTWSVGGTSHSLSSSTGTTFFPTGGRTAGGGTYSAGGWTAGGTRPLGGTSATGGMTAIPWTSVCEIGLTECDSDGGISCVDTQTDANNCGFCGHGCKPGWHCSAGECRAPTCTGKYSLGPSLFDMRDTPSSYITSMITADFNHDGVPDLAATDYDSSSIVVRLGKPHGEFDTLTTYQTGYQPQALAAADFNGDGKLDLLAVCDSNQSGINVLFGKGDGTFETNGIVQLYQASRVAVGDLNGDTFLDLITDTGAYTGLQVLLGTGAGTFAKPETYATDSYFSSFALIDLNADSKLDLVATNSAKGSITVWLGSGDGKLGAPTNYVVGADYPVALAVGDVDKDNKPDVVVACNSPNMVAIMRGDGAGALNASVPYATSGSTTVALGDLNHDGNLDIVLSEPYMSYGYEASVGVRLGLGTGAFGKEALFPFAPYTLPPIVGDFDGDSLIDIATADLSRSAAVVLPGNGDGTFYDIVKYPSSSCSSSVTTGDVNHDGMLDLLSAGGYALMSEYLGPIQSLTSPTATYNVSASRLTLGDFDADGEPDVVGFWQNSNSLTVLFGEGGGKFGETRTIAANWPRSVNIADVNHDGWQDLVILNNNTYTVSVSLNLGNRNFATPQEVAKASYIYDVALGDLNGDELPDMVMSAGTALQVAFANSSGTWTTTIWNSVSGTSNWVKLADFNNDGKLDAVISTYDSSNSIKIYLGQGDGYFVLGQEFIEQDYVLGIAVDDVNGDGHADIIATSNANATTLILGKGDGTFSGESKFGYNWSYGASSYGVEVGDLNGDGWVDVIAPDPYSSNCQVNVMYGRCR